MNSNPQEAHDFPPSRPSVIFTPKPWYLLIVVIICFGVPVVGWIDGEELALATIVSLLFFPVGSFFLLLLVKPSLYVLEVGEKGLVLRAFGQQKCFEWHEISPIFLHRFFYISGIGFQLKTKHNQKPLLHQWLFRWTGCDLFVPTLGMDRNQIEKEISIWQEQTLEEIP